MTRRLWYAGVPNFTVTMQIYESPAGDLTVQRGELWARAVLRGQQNTRQVELAPERGRRLGRR